jgi:hypothetical protein
MRTREGPAQMTCRPSDHMTVAPDHRTPHRRPFVPLNLDPSEASRLGHLAPMAAGAPMPPYRRSRFWYASTASIRCRRRKSGHSVSVT